MTDRNSLFKLAVMQNGPWRKQDIFKLCVTIVLLSLTLFLFFPFYSEILLAAVFAFAIEPTLGRWLQPRHLRWKFSVAGILAAMYLILAGPITLVAYRSYSYFVETSHTGFQNTETFQKLSEFRGKLISFVNDTLASFHLENRFDLSAVSEDSLSRLGNFAMEISTKFIYRIPNVLLSVFVFTVALYFFIAEARLVKNSFNKLQLLTVGEANKMISIFQKSSFNTVVTSLSLGVMTATIVALGAIFLEAGDFVVVFVITFICSFIPIIGSGPVALALGVYKLVMGSIGQALGFVLVAVVVGIVDNAVRPYLISSSSKDDLHPVLNLLALIGALEIFGMPGIFLGPVLATSAIQLVQVFYPRPEPATAVMGSAEKKDS